MSYNHFPSIEFPVNSPSQQIECCPMYCLTNRTAVALLLKLPIIQNLPTSSSPPPLMCPCGTGVIKNFWNTMGYSFLCQMQWPVHWPVCTKYDIILLLYNFLISVEIMGGGASQEQKLGKLAPFLHVIIHPEPQSSGYQIPQLQKLIKKAFLDLNSRDPMGKRLYLNQILNFILGWLPKKMQSGTSLFDAEKIVRRDLEKACKDYPISEIVKIDTKVKALGTKPFPDLYGDIKIKTQQNFTDRVKELCQRSKEVSYQFNKEMQLILQKDGGYKFITGYKFTGTKAYLRIMTKILDQFLSEEQQSKQVYTDLNHYYYTPVFNYFNTIIDKNIGKIKIELYDWIRCKCSFRNIQDLQKAYDRLRAAYGTNIFRVKNRINQNTRDLLINVQFKTQYTEVQLALEYNDLTYEFQHKLYELTREKLGIAYSCFTFMLSDSGDSHGSSSGIMTKLGYLKKTLLREKIQPWFERLTIEDAESIRDDIKKILGKWSIVALKSGVADASDPTNMLKKQLYGPEIEEMLIIKKRSAKDKLYNWLNWMN